jgi:hypothetical protein
MCFDGDLQKCDAKRPCTPCVENGRSQCAYEEGPLLHRAARRSRSTGVIQSPSSYTDESSPISSFSRLTSEDRFLLSQSLYPSDTIHPTSFSTNSTPSHVSPEEQRVPQSDEFEPCIPGEGLSEVVLFRETAHEPNDHTFVVAPPLSIHPFARPPSIPPGLQIPLSLLDPELLQISDTTPSELNLSLYAFSPKLSQSRVVYAEIYPFSRLATLLHLRKLGIHLTGQKEDAIMRGDTSGDVVNPFFVHISNAIGMHLRAGVGESPAMIQLHAKHAQRTLEQMSEAGKSDNPELKAQMLLYATSATLFQRWFQPARTYLRKACDTINAANLRFIPVFGRPSELTEEVQERFAVLSQIVYMENYLGLAIDRTPPTMATRIEEEFRHELQVRGLH